MERENLNLLEFIRALVEGLMLTTEYNEAEIQRLVDAIRADLDGIRAHYAEPAPLGAEAVQELMLETLDIYDQSLNEILLFLADHDEDHLRESVYQAEAANDVLLAVEDVIQTNKHLLSEMVEA